MALYDDLDTKQGPEKVAGWSSGIKLLQTQLQVKKATQPIIPMKTVLRKQPVLTPVVNLKAKKEQVDLFGVATISQSFVEKSKPVTVTTTTIPSVSGSSASGAYSWDVVDEYDPLWPNEYDKLVKDKKVKEGPVKLPQNNYGRNRREYKRGLNVNKNASADSDGPSSSKKSGFAGRPVSDDEDDFQPGGARASGAAIAPPASLQESFAQIPDGSKLSQLTAYGGSSVAAKIMAKYGFKDGQGLGKQEQGMSMALQVEKTSKRGGRIVHEKDIALPVPISEVPQPQLQPAPQTPPQEPSITEIMKSPSKVVLLRNMVGPGDVDDDLEPEVKDECNTKYGEVVTVVIHEVPNVVPEEAVRIFVEFKRMESAIKAVVDLNGRFFGGRQVRAGFYSQERFDCMDLL
ncbi:splicing factor 45 [Toxorhynchites rutilus septentrionalis]|uniref:splicing factor 45 n=1 Tax=Toxorhynchites rutilus septentrionalis TaxID=329112 RepID=UPI0024798D99|nr:splicing factor 45 [Toxorhynchites rutilus septentrionalis]